MPAETCDVLIAGGGTAGHTNPGIAIAQALVKAGVRTDRVRFVGGKRGNESKLVPEAGFEIDLLSGRGIPRSLSKAAVTAALQTAGGLAQSFAVLRKRRPQVVVCLGGYAAFGPSVAALLTRRPVVVSEQNARASAVNRWVGRFAKACALPFESTDLPRGVVTGNPIRAEVLEEVRTASQSASRVALGLPQEIPVVAVWSGSLGSTAINQSVRDLAVKWADRSDLALYHVVGKRDWAEFGAAPKEVANGALHYRTVEYEDRMPLLLAAASVAIGRAGASTVAELAVAGLPSVLVPLPGAPRDHQRANARELEDVGGAHVLDQGSLTAEKLDGLLEPWLVDTQQLETMRRSLKSVAFPEAAESVARLVIETGGLHLGSD